MHGLWNNIKSSVGETLDNIILSPKKLRKKFAEKKQNSTLSEQSNSFEKETPETSPKQVVNMAEGLSLTGGLEEVLETKRNIENITPHIPSLITVEGECDKDDVLERQETGYSQRSNGSSAEQPSISSWTACQFPTSAVAASDQNVKAQPPLTRHNVGDNNQMEKPVSRLTGALDHKKGGDTLSSVSLNPSPITKTKPGPPRRTNTLGVIDIELINDVGENESVEIDIADFESTKEEDKLLNTRRQSISDRINRRRTSELAAEIIRLSAEHRRKEFSDLLDEHEEIVQNIEIWKKTGVLPPSRCPKSRSNLETVDDEDNSDDILDEEPHYFRQINDNASSYHSQQDNKENNTLPRSH